MAAPISDHDPASGGLRLAIPQGDVPRRSRVRRLLRRLVVAAVVLAVAGLGVAAAMQSGYVASETPTARMLTRRVERGKLMVTVTEDGNVESASNVDVKCEVAGGSTILWIIKDGTQVKEGEELVHLDSSTIEDQVTQQKIVTAKAKAMQIEAKKQFDAATIAVQEYREGTYLKELQTLESQITVANENLHSAQNALQHAERMARKGYITALQRDAQRFAVQRSQLDLDAANTAKQVLEKFTKAKMLVDLESARDTAEARMLSEDAAFELEDSRLKRMLVQLEKCTIRAPRDGMVIYANETDRRGMQQAIIEEGVAVREHQSIIRLPDLTKMQVKVTVHESKVDSLTVGMPVHITIQDRTFQGRVTSIANQAEPSTFWAPSVKEYAAYVSVDSDPTGLRPGMTASVEILVADLPNVLSVPIQAVVEQGGRFFCWVTGAKGPERRPVLLGATNDRDIEIRDGVQEGDQVLLNPRAVVADAREESVVASGEGASNRFGNHKPGAQPAIATASPTTPPPSGDAPTAVASATGLGGPAGADTPPGGDAPEGRSQRRGDFNLMQFDKDGDKKISRDEAPERMQAFFDQIDTDQDGFIDAKERAAMIARMRQMQAAGGGPGGPDGGIPAGRGAVGGM